MWSRAPVSSCSYNQSKWRYNFARPHSQTLRKKERYRSLVENTNDAVVIHDLDGVITFANGRAAALLGRKLSELHEPQSAEQALSGIREVFDTGKSRTAEWHT